jgi:hypothetical protein
MIDMEKLTAAPWVACDRSHWGHSPHEVTGLWEQGGTMIASGISQHSDAAFIALARNAFDVMIRRGWSATPIGKTGYWTVLDCVPHLRIADRDPFTALVDADKFMKEHGL